MKEEGWEDKNKIKWYSEGYVFSKETIATQEEQERILKDLEPHLKPEFIMELETETDAKAFIQGIVGLIKKSNNNGGEDV